MTDDEINRLFDEMQRQFEASGDDGDRPGLITYQTDDYVRNGIRTCCTSPQRGMRYRGVQVLVSRERQTRVWSRAEAAAAGETAGPFEDLKAIEEAFV